MKIKALISFAVTAKLICVFVFAYANVGFLMTQLNYGSCFMLRVGKQIYTCIIFDKRIIAPESKEELIFVSKSKLYINLGGKGSTW